MGLHDYHDYKPEKIKVIMKSGESWFRHFFPHATCWKKGKKEKQSSLNLDSWDYTITMINNRKKSR